MCVGTTVHIRTREKVIFKNAKMSFALHLYYKISTHKETHRDIICIMYVYFYFCTVNTEFLQTRIRFFFFFLFFLNIFMRAMCICEYFRPDSLTPVGGQFLRREYCYYRPCIYAVCAVAYVTTYGRNGALPAQ